MSLLIRTQTDIANMLDIEALPVNVRTNYSLHSDQIFLNIYLKPVCSVKFVAIYRILIHTVIHPENFGTLSKRSSLSKGYLYHKPN